MKYSFTLPSSQISLDHHTLPSAHVAKKAKNMASTSEDTSSQNEEEIEIEDEEIEVLAESIPMAETSNTRQKRTRSSAWRYFSRFGTNEGESKCTICAESVKHRSNTTNLLKVCKYMFQNLKFKLV